MSHESYVTTGTCNCILAALFVLATEERRDAQSDVWMTRTRSAHYRIFVRLLSLRPATLSLGPAAAES
jgi:hypothetical protein